MSTKPNIAGIQFDREWEDALDPYPIPEENLIAAVVERAVADLFDREMHVRREARIWFTSADPFMLYSFVWCFTQLGKEDVIETIRSQVLAMENFSFRTRRRAITESRLKPERAKSKRFRFSKEAIL